MKKTLLRKVFAGAFLVCICFSLLVLPAFAEPPCSITVTVTSPSGNEPIAGYSVNFLKVAEADGNGYMFTPEFASAGITYEEILADEAEGAKYLFEYAKREHTAVIEKKTDADGKVRFDAEEGIYLVFCAPAQKVVFSPFLVALPVKVSGGLLHSVQSKPKTEIPSAPVNTRTVKVTKIWDDENNKYLSRPDSIMVTLLRNGAVYKNVVLNDANGWKHSFDKLPFNGEYTVSEAEIKDYTVTYSGSANSGFVIINKFSGEVPPETPPAPDYASVSVRKVWDDGTGEGRPASVTVQLIADGTVLSTASLSALGNWQHTFTKLKKDVSYTVKEILPDGYSVSYSGNSTAGFVITNKKSDTPDPGVIPDPSYPDVPEKTSVFVQKVWNDDGNSDKRPDSVTVLLISGGEVLQKGAIEAALDWEYTFGDLDASRAYTLLEVAVDGYTASYSGSAAEGFTITNTYTGKTDPGLPPDPTHPQDPETPDIPDPVKPVEPQIPQTGHMVIPAYILMVLGAAVVLAGLVLVLKGNRSKFIILFGFILVFAATGIFIAYDREETVASENANILLRSVKAAMPSPTYAEEFSVNDSAQGSLPNQTHLGYTVSGVFSIPTAGIEAPIQGEWSYDLLKVSPCRYSGSIEGRDLILLGHNYRRHFGELKKCSVGDIAQFTDVNGKVYDYTVSAIEVLHKNALDALTSSQYDLSVFTCTDSGENRLVLRFNLIE